MTNCNWQYVISSHGSLLVKVIVINMIINRYCGNDYLVVNIVENNDDLLAQCFFSARVHFKCIIYAFLRDPGWT